MGARACLNIVFLTEKDTFEGRIIMFKQAHTNTELIFMPLF